nr:immunoglobulin heavy chain junction region [Macaca mulatta]
CVRDVYGWGFDYW